MKNDIYSLAIVIPAFKVSFLKETMESIVAQTDQRFNLYIGDDSSPHNMNSIIEEFENKINLVYHRFETNLGGTDLVSQWERCIALTQGEPYIWLFSDDDTMDPNCVKMFYETLEQNPECELFHFNINMIDDFNGGRIKTLPEFPKTLSAGEYLEEKLRGNIVSYVVEFIFSREIYNRVEGFQNFDLAWGSDFMTWLKMSSISTNGIITILGNKCKVNWRKSSENISPNKAKPILLRKIKSLINNAVFIKKELNDHQKAYYPLKKSFHWVRFPLGYIYANRNLLSPKEIRESCVLFNKNVGYTIQTLLSYFKIRFL